MIEISVVKQKALSSSNKVFLFSWIAIAVCGSLVFWGNLRFGKSVLAVGLEDDFFYYAQVAQNLALHGRSTFDGIHLTNGYHPLWLLVLTLITKLTGVGGVLNPSSIFPFAISLETIQVALLLGVSYFVLRVSRLYCSDIISACIQMLVASSALVLIRTGMEVGLTLLLGFGLLWFRLRPDFRWSPANSFYYGFLASMMVLSRLDTILFVGLLLIFDLIPNAVGIQERLRRAISFGIGIFPVLGYVLLNIAIFKTATPISGTAKQLRHHYIPSLRTFESFKGFFTERGSPLLIVWVLLTLLGLVLLCTRSWEGRKGQRGVFWAALLFPLLHLFSVATLSDWPLWPWYLYVWVVSGAVSAVMFFSAEMVWVKGTPLPVKKTCFALSLLFLVAYGAAVARSSNPAHNRPYVAGLEIADFANQHPGIYAMGDRSGVVGYLINSPVLQLEGLMMDKEYLKNIQAEKDLLGVLKQYGVDYYISTRSTPDAEGCYAFREPWQAGPDSFVMNGRICQAPVAEFTHDVWVNDIFDLRTGNAIKRGDQVY